MRQFLVIIAALVACLAFTTPAQAQTNAGWGPSFPLEEPTSQTGGTGKWNCVRQFNGAILCVGAKQERADYMEAFIVDEPDFPGVYRVRIAPNVAPGVQKNGTEEGRATLEKALNEDGVGLQIPAVNGASAGSGGAVPGLSPVPAPGSSFGFADATTCVLAVRVSAPDNEDGVYDYHNVKIVWNDGSPDLYVEMGEGEVWDINHTYPSHPTEPKLTSSYAVNLDTGSWTSLSVVHPVPPSGTTH